METTTLTPLTPANTPVNQPLLVWKETPVILSLLILISVFLYILFQDGLRHMVGYWNNKEEYSHGILIPFVAAFLIWQKRDLLEKIPFEGSWTGFFVVIGGLLLFFIGEFSTLYIVIEYSFIIVLTGLALTYMGLQAFKLVLTPLLMLLLMIPLPEFILNNLSAELQLISSAIGVWFIQLFGISVFLEGNVIDLGSMKLQVVDACSGLRYLFPLMTFGFIAAYFFKAPFWQRAFIFLSTIPITILMNSFRIGVIGVTVEYWGESMAQGFLHDFEGWIVFMACAGVLVLEMWVLTKIRAKKLPLREVFGLEFPQSHPKNAKIRYRTFSQPMLGVVLLLGLVTLLSQFLPEREEIVPERKDFSTFPMRIGDWKGKSDRLEQMFIDKLSFSDYMIADYVNNKNKKESANFYVAYYNSQKKGASAHSPRTCIPGGGWKITSLEEKIFENIRVADQPLRVNRTIIRKGGNSQLVYYWFQQRGRVITNEYMVKWYLFWDALTRNRTDGALVRLTTFVPKGQDLAEADKRLTGLLGGLSQVLGDYVPE